MLGPTRLRIAESGLGCREEVERVGNSTVGGTLLQFPSRNC